MNDTAPDWRDRAACTRSTISFFPEGRRYEEQSAAAKAVCRTCPVRVDCLLHAINEGEEWGVWGGLDERERAPLRAGRARLTSVIHHPSVVDEALLDATRIGMLAEQVSLPLEPWQQRVIDLACIIDRTGARPHIVRPR